MTHRTSTVYQAVAFLVCVAFGLALILNIHPAGDGMWFWYASLLRTHHKLYADLHLPLQPLFVLEITAFQILLGKSWLASKVPAFLQLATYCYGVVLVNRSSTWKDWQKAIIFVGVFALTMYGNFYRFDDYHITTECFQIATVYLLLRMHAGSSERHTILIPAALGVLSGLSTANRINDGAALLLAAIIGTLFVARGRKLLGTAIIVGLAAFTLLSVVLITGDSLHDWIEFSILAAAKIKGGTGNILLYPFHLPILLFKDMARVSHLRIYFVCLPGILALWIAFARYRERLNGSRSVAALIGTIVGSTALLKAVGLRAGSVEIVISDCLVLFLFVLSLLVAIRAVMAIAGRPMAHWDTREVLIFIPFGLLLAGAMTSARTLPDIYPPVAITLLLAPIASPLRIQQVSSRTAYLALTAVLGISTFYYKTWQPYFWHYYTSHALFHERQWYTHPDFGPMYIETEQLVFMKDVCAHIDQGSGARELLSIPYPYGNYFCNIPPWHGYVQTWFDTSSKDTIDQLMAELQNSPPTWILYQRQLPVIKVHEAAFNNDNPLPQRALDKVIIERLATGQWTAKSWHFQGADWLLIHTTRERAN